MTWIELAQEKIELGREGEADLLFKGGLLFEPEFRVPGGLAIKSAERGTLGVPPLPGGFARTGIVLGGAERAAIGVLEEKGADFIGGGSHDGAELAERFAIGVEKLSA